MYQVLDLIESMYNCAVYSQLTYVVYVANNTLDYFNFILFKIKLF